MKIKLEEGATIPTKANPTDAGFDLTAISSRIDASARFIEYDTGVSIALPEGKVGLIFARSSVSKYDLDLSNAVGVIDQDYRGTIKLRFRPTGPHHYKKGDRVGQLVIIDLPKIELEVVEDLDATERGDGGFGSTGE